MRLSGKELASFRDRPDERFGAALIWGPDSVEVSRWRDRVRQALIGEAAEADMGIERIAPADARRDPAALADSLNEIGFFGGKRLVVVESATDATTDALAAALQAVRPGAAFLLVTAAALPGRSRLRKLFEESRGAAAVSVRDRATDRASLAASLAADGIEADGEAIARLSALAPELDGAAIDDLVSRALLHAEGRGAARMAVEDIEACAPLALSGAADRIVEDVLLFRLDGFGARFRRLEAQGVSPSSVVAAATRALRRLLEAETGASGRFGGGPNLPEEAARRWNSKRIQWGLAALLDVERALRASPAVAPHALVERTLLRLAFGDQPMSRRQSPSSSSSDR